MSAPENLNNQNPNIAGTGTLPPQNPLQQAMADYHLLEQANASLTDQVETFSDLANKLQAENDALRNQIKEQADFYGKQITTITTHRDRLERLLKGLLTRFKVIKECFAQAEIEARQEAAAKPSDVSTAIGQPLASTPLPMNDLG